MAILYRLLLLFAYFCFINILFYLPGSVFPKDNWLDAIWFDKWVHIGLFFILCYGICWMLKGKGKGKRFYTLLFIGAGLYGIGVELIQDQYIPNRSFDLGDWGADLVGSFIGICIWRLRTGTDYRKK